MCVPNEKSTQVNILNLPYLLQKYTNCKTLQIFSDS